MPSELPGIRPEQIDRSERSQWRYRAALPELFSREISLGEGSTPLLTVGTTFGELRVKTEWFNPSGSFKDRGMSVLISTLAALGIDDFLEDSSGNGGSSAAAYAAAAGMHAHILVPRGTSAAKQQQSLLYGATVEEFDGTRTETAAEAERRALSVFYASHNWHPAFLQGVKLMSYEIWEDLGFVAPDNVVVPAGAGSLVLGLSLGFGELLRAGSIERIPRIFAAQPANCAPLVEAFERGAAGVESGRLDRWSPTIAEGASIGAPVRDREVLAAIRASGGGLHAVSESDIVAALRHLLTQGLFTEPTGALGFAAALHSLDTGLITAGETTVVVLTGSGLKAAQAMSQLIGQQ
ncbi:threonine synthase [Leifsonia sp. YAF41]|uniref:threonine synthase n=1 Tax=Leifsonia sp. YAF41 TaxID=3233086 RepID=UPI003F9BB1D1